MTGTVFESQGGVYRIHTESGEILEASLRGKLKREAIMGDQVVIGDRVVVVSRKDGTATVERVEERHTQVVRRGPGGRRPKVVAANVDRLVVVAAAAKPEPRQFLLDRLLVIGEANDLDLAVVFNKRDLVGDEETLGSLASLYRGIGYRVLETSAVTGRGLEELVALLCTGTSALVGPSGVGKSSLLNAIQPELGLKTGELSHKQARGRHTTVSARLIPLGCGGLVADTPGFSDVGVWGADPRDLEAFFPDFHPFRDGCKFRGCTHLHEPECGVQAALEEGRVDEGRFGSYRGLVEEAEGS